MMELLWDLHSKLDAQQQDLEELKWAKDTSTSAHAVPPISQWGTSRGKTTGHQDDPAGLSSATEVIDLGGAI